MTTENSLSSSAMLALTSDALGRGGYTTVADALSQNESSALTRVFEDPFGFVAIVVYETWSDLSKKWPDAQAALVSLMSSRLDMNSAKVWEGYLVLLTPDPHPSAESIHLEAINRNTSRLRKIAA